MLKCARDFKSRNLPLKLLVNNAELQVNSAGVTLGTLRYTDEGVARAAGQLFGLLCFDSPARGQPGGRCTFKGGYKREWLRIVHICKSSRRWL
ncbi:hypothetical protein KC19_1G019600 [Ceratodon purpureus]|uniref:Uncharacterized protein n=1 Tax=Ceratodon purpureus TaxID=3225 RepID=A0A8T0J397_CERPU|nr:hypothetical protein KC19_1G019600 [Ceratodon purpureus]